MLCRNCMPRGLKQGHLMCLISHFKAISSYSILFVSRYGQQKISHIYRLVTDNSIEKRIYDRQVNKQGECAKKKGFHILKLRLLSNYPGLQQRMRSPKSLLKGIGSIIPLYPLCNSCSCRSGESQIHGTC